VGFPHTIQNSRSSPAGGLVLKLRILIERDPSIHPDCVTHTLLLSVAYHVNTIRSGRTLREIAIFTGVPRGSL